MGVKPRKLGAALKWRPRPGDIQGLRANSIIFGLDLIIFTAGDPVPIRQQQRYRPSPSALREIRKYQGSTRLLLVKLPFTIVVRYNE